MKWENIKKLPIDTVVRCAMREFDGITRMIGKIKEKNEDYLIIEGDIEDIPKNLRKNDISLWVDEDTCNFDYFEIVDMT